MNFKNRDVRSGLRTAVVVSALIAASCGTSAEATAIDSTTTCAEYLTFDDDARGRAVRTLGGAAGWGDAANPMSRLSFDSHCGQRPTQTMEQAISLFARSSEAPTATTEEVDSAATDAEIGTTTTTPPPSICDEEPSGVGLITNPGLIEGDLLDVDLATQDALGLVEALIQNNEEPVALLTALTTVEPTFGAIQYDPNDRFREVVGRLRFAGVEAASLFRDIDLVAQQNCGFPIFGDTATERIDEVSPAPSPDGGAVIAAGTLYGEECYWGGRMVPPRQAVFNCSEGDLERFALVDLATGDILGRAEIPEDPSGGGNIFVNEWGIGHLRWVDQPPEGLELGTTTLTLTRSAWNDEAEVVALTEPIPRAANAGYLGAKIAAASPYGIAAVYASPETNSTTLAFLEPNGRTISTIDLGEQPRSVTSGYNSMISNRLARVGDLLVDVGTRDLVRSALGEPILLGLSDVRSDPCLGVSTASDRESVLYYLVERTGALEVTPVATPPKTGSVRHLPTSAGIVHWPSFEDPIGLDTAGNQLWTISQDIATGVGQVAGRLFISNPAQEWILVDAATGTEITDDSEAAFLSEQVVSVNSGGSNSRQLRSIRAPESGSLMISYVSRFVTGAGAQEHTILFRDADYCGSID